MVSSSQMEATHGACTFLYTPLPRLIFATNKCKISILKLRKQQGIAIPQTDTRSKNYLDILQERIDKSNREIKSVISFFNIKTSL